MRACRRHPKERAGWNCASCRADLCPDCVTKQPGGPTGTQVPVCCFCGRTALPLSVHRRAARPFGPRLWRAFDFPLGSAGIIALLFVANRTDKRSANVSGSSRFEPSPSPPTAQDSDQQGDDEGGDEVAAAGGCRERATAVLLRWRLDWSGGARVPVGGARVGAGGRHAGGVPYDHHGGVALARRLGRDGSTPGGGPPLTPPLAGHQRARPASAPRVWAGGARGRACACGSRASSD